MIPLLGLALAAGLAILSANPVLAHSLLLESTPAAGSVLTASPEYLTLRFNNRVERRLSRVHLVDERGRVARAPIAGDDAQPAETLRHIEALEGRRSADAAANALLRCSDIGKGYVEGGHASRSLSGKSDALDLDEHPIR